ncbi:hypothetical protein CAEBREN_22016 [Caenorhabditis brenneri]|uniref:Uncharacterized protein n=1 Tax=Caenorhabditis brenneri TaxID=135651 RepID=G0MMU9_CAEBE|nr:hypothetical protein CAEBREN_22016 [Caenorhabditis brenneri]
MNLTIFLGLAFLASSFVAVEAKHFVTRGEVLKGVNELRAMYANETQIGNMNEVVYDMKLETIAKKEVEKHKVCDHKTMMVTLDGNLQLFKFSAFSFWFSDSQVMEDMVETGKTKMAFATGKCKYNKEEDDVFIFVMDTDPNIPMVPGKPGSRCPENRPFSNNGLCGTRKGYARKGQVNKEGVLKFAKFILNKR